MRDSSRPQALSSRRSRLHHALLMAVREHQGREASPTLGIIDSQTVKVMAPGGPRGYDAAKKIRGRKRHILVDGRGNLLAVRVTDAAVQDRDGAVDLFRQVRVLFPLDRRHYCRQRLCRAVRGGADRPTHGRSNRPPPGLRQGLCLASQTMARRASVRRWPILPTLVGRSRNAPASLRGHDTARLHRALRPCTGGLKPRPGRALRALKSEPAESLGKGLSQGERRRAPSTFGSTNGAFVTLSVVWLRCGLFAGQTCESCSEHGSVPRASGMTGWRRNGSPKRPRLL